MTCDDLAQFWKAEERRERWLMASSAAVALAFLIATRSRAAWIGGGVAGIWSIALMVYAARPFTFTLRGRLGGILLIVGFAATIAAVLTVLGNLIADITYAAVDPRISYDGKRKA